MQGKIIQKLTNPISASPLAVYRMGFGVLMLFSSLRFWLKGWIHEFYINPEFHFTYFGFEWIKPLSGNGMYLVFLAIILSSICIIIGFKYKVAITAFFLLFTYVELIDKTTYLNHYYFVSVLSFLMIWLPANNMFSLDRYLNPEKYKDLVPAWTVYVIVFQVSIVYVFAGLAKINKDWLLEAEPLNIWLKPKYNTDIIGGMFRYKITAFVFSWFSLLYDCTIPIFLSIKRTRKWAFFVVVLFHVLTGLLFPIGVFPYVMIFSTLIFFPAQFHQKVLDTIKKMLRLPSKSYVPNDYSVTHKFSSQIKILIIVAMCFVQLLMPWRYLLYPGNLFWTEEGYRFSWRVMLVEKAGIAFFYVKHPDYPGYLPINNAEHLTPQQEKQMSFQPDMLIQYAHYLKKAYRNKIFIEGNDTIVLSNPDICADVFVTLNGRISQPLVSKETILSNKKYNLAHKSWLEPFKE